MFKEKMVELILISKLYLVAALLIFFLNSFFNYLERRLDPAANLFKIKKFWPLILGKNGNETEKHCYFMVVPKRGTSEAVQRQYRKAIS